MESTASGPSGLRAPGPVVTASRHEDGAVLTQNHSTVDEIVPTRVTLNTLDRVRSFSVQVSLAEY